MNMVAIVQVTMGVVVAMLKALVASCYIFIDMIEKTPLLSQRSLGLEIGVTVDFHLCFSICLCFADSFCSLSFTCCRMSSFVFVVYRHSICFFGVSYACIIAFLSINPCDIVTFVRPFSHQLMQISNNLFFIISMAFSSPPSLFNPSHYLSNS